MQTLGHIKSLIGGSRRDGAALHGLDFCLKGPDTAIEDISLFYYTLCPQPAVTLLLLCSYRSFRDARPHPAARDHGPLECVRACVLVLMSLD